MVARMSLEPKFHFFEDCLPDDDPRAYTIIDCQDCSKMVHCPNNETMVAWFDTGVGVICLDCFYSRYNVDPSLGEPWEFEALEMKP